MRPRSRKPAATLGAAAIDEEPWDKRSRRSHVCGPVMRRVTIALVALVGLVLAFWTFLVPSSGNTKVMQTWLHRVVSVWCTNATQASFAPDEVFSWPSSMRAARAEIYRELLAYETREEGKVAPPFESLDAMQHGLTFKGGCWHTLWVLIYGREAVTTEHFPLTMRRLRTAGATTAMFSILDPGCTIRGHRGENKAVLRYHLGLEVPEPDGDAALELRVWHEDHRAKPRVYFWANGSDLLFDDTFHHMVVNNRTRGRRVVLFVDVPRQDCGVGGNWLLRQLVYLIGRTDRVQGLLAKVNRWPTLVRSLAVLSSRMSSADV